MESIQLLHVLNITIVQVLMMNLSYVQLDIHVLRARPNHRNVQRISTALRVPLLSRVWMELIVKLEVKQNFPVSVHHALHYVIHVVIVPRVYLVQKELCLRMISASVMMAISEMKICVSNVIHNVRLVQLPLHSVLDVLLPMLS